MRQRYNQQEALLAKQVDSGDGLFHMMASATLTRSKSTSSVFTVLIAIDAFDVTIALVSVTGLSDFTAFTGLSDY